jgi:hypothetical protein
MVPGSLNLLVPIIDFKIINMIVTKNQQHSYHLVDPSPWPVVAAISASMVTFGGVLYMHEYWGGGFLWKFGLLMILFMMFSKDLGEGPEEASVETNDSFEEDEEDEEDEDDFDWGPIEENEPGYVYTYEYTYVYHYN